jgi:hypothetical protein
VGFLGCSKIKLSSFVPFEEEGEEEEEEEEEEPLSNGGH